MFKTHNFLSIITAFLFSFIWESSAWAVQTHGGAEGLISHEIGHFLFVSGMGYLLFRLYRPKTTEPGWSEFRGFSWLIIGWNILTFTGHWMNEFVAPAKYIKSSGRIVAFSIEGPLDALFYLTRLDHLVLVPAFIFLLVALRKWSRTT